MPLTITRRVGQSFIIGNDIKITILEDGRGSSGRVRVAIQAPRDVLVYREEIWEQRLRERENANRDKTGSDRTGPDETDGENSSKVCDPPSGTSV